MIVQPCKERREVLTGLYLNITGFFAFGKSSLKSSSVKSFMKKKKKKKKKKKSQTHSPTHLTLFLRCFFFFFFPCASPFQYHSLSMMDSFFFPPGVLLWNSAPVILDHLLCHFHFFGYLQQVHFFVFFQFFFPVFLIFLFFFASPNVILRGTPPPPSPF